MFPTIDCTNYLSITNLWDEYFWSYIIFSHTKIFAYFSQKSYFLENYQSDWKTFKTNSLYFLTLFETVDNHFLIWPTQFERIKKWPLKMAERPPFMTVTPCTSQKTTHRKKNVQWNITILLRNKTCNDDLCARSTIWDLRAKSHLTAQKYDLTTKTLLLGLRGESMAVPCY